MKIKSQKLLAMVLAWENLRRFLWCWSSFCCFYSYFIFICRCFSFCCCIFIWFSGLFTLSPALNPSFSGPWRLPLALRSTRTTFDCLFFFIYRERYAFEWVFFTHRRLLPYAPSRHFGTTCFYQGPTGSRQLLSWNLQGFILILKTQTRPISLFDSQ